MIALCISLVSLAVSTYCAIVCRRIERASFSDHVEARDEYRSLDD